MISALSRTIIHILASFATFWLPLFAQGVNLEEGCSECVLETKRLEIAGYPYAFNPSMVRWGEHILLSFRVIPDPAHPYTSMLGVVLLNEQFEQIGEAQILGVREAGSRAPSRAEDGRLLWVGNELYIIYSDNPDLKISRGGFRMVVGELRQVEGKFVICNAQRLMQFEGADDGVREKSWTPFVFEDSLLLSYSISPHLIFYPVPGTEQCETVAETACPFPWDWGILRGGTQALLIDTGEYLTFFHSVKLMKTLHSDGKEVEHYFMGAYTFAPTPPFHILRYTSDPIVARGFYSGESYRPHWKPIQCIFPAGMMIEGNTIIVSYGRQDHEMWIIKFDKAKFLSQLCFK